MRRAISTDTITGRDARIFIFPKTERIPRQMKRWLAEYNSERPMSLNNLTPEEYRLLADAPGNPAKSDGNKHHARTAAARFSE
jgi:hypothetical protein